MVRRRRTSRRAKSVSLSKHFWLRNSADIKLYRDKKLAEQGGVCAVSGVPLEVGCLDHCHKAGIGSEGKCRSVLLSEVNCLEGKYLKLFKRMKLDTKYNLTFPDFLINLGTYLKEDNEDAPLHFKYMDDFRKQVKRYRKDTLLLKLKEEYGIIPDDKLLVSELVQIYMQAWVDEIEKELKGEET